MALEKNYFIERYCYIDLILTCLTSFEKVRYVIFFIIKHFCLEDMACQREVRNEEGN